MSKYINKLELYRLDIKDLGEEYLVDKLILRVLRGLLSTYDTFLDAYYIR
jgi:hypothetical protein